MLCTGNSCRSQIAEGYLRHFAGDKVKIFSAGVETHGVNPRAVAVMLEDGIDISAQTSNHVDEYREVRFDYVITVCDNARERCPVFPTGAVQIHHNFPDPGKAVGSEQSVADEFRSVRRLIREFIIEFNDKYLS